tara:strand:- start:1343 stop:1708 length:366 start_codon:yes stop_codon:yes gene_type:complete
MENKVPLGEGFMYPDEKKYCFWKRSAADVEIGDDFFTFTPGFGEFKETDDLWEYLKKYVIDNKLEYPDLNIEWLRHCHYEINPDTLELGEFLESSGIDYECYEWNPETQEFDEREDEEEEE